MTEKTDLQEKIDELMQQQSEALNRATYVPMTVEESNAFDDRANGVAKLRRRIAEI
jgi:hypothetical protein